jgi:hypothetical protein
MGYLGFFYVESKSFELSSEAGKRCKLTEWGRGKLKSLEMGFSRLLWLLKSLEEVSSDGVEMGSCRNHRMEGSVVFIQKRQNGNGRFMEISEFGRGGKRSQLVIPEGWDKCGWNQCINQLRLLAKHIEVQGSSKHKKKPTVQDQFVVEGKSFAEVVQGKKKGCDQEVLPVMDAEKVLNGGVAVSSERKSVEKGACAEIEGVDVGEVPASNSQSQGYCCVGKEVMMTGDGQMIGQEGKADHEGLLAFNAVQELWTCRETLRKLKGEVETGMARLDWVFKNFVGSGPGQGSRHQNMVRLKEKEKWIKQTKKWGKPKWVGLGAGSMPGVGTGFKPSDSKKQGKAGPGVTNKVGSGSGMKRRGPERANNWSILRNEETMSSGPGKSKPVVPESSGELGSDIAPPVRAKEGPGCSYGGRGDLEEGVFPLFLADGSFETSSERVGESSRPVCLGSECLGSVVAHQGESMLLEVATGKAPGESAPLETVTGKDSGESVPLETATGKASAESVPPEMAKGKVSGEFASPERTTEKALVKSLIPPISTLPIGTNGGLVFSSKASATPVRGEGGKIGVSGLLTRHSISWVDGRTGFGPAATLGRDGNSFMPESDPSKGGPGCVASTIDAQTLICSVVDRGTKTVMAEAEANDQVSNFKGGDLSLCCDSSGTDLSVGAVSVEGLEVSVVAETADGSGQGLVSLNSVDNFELVDSPVSEKMKTTMEVGSVVGLTCDGQEGLKVDCFKRIIVENQGRGGSVDDAILQEEERGNCSDYEA